MNFNLQIKILKRKLRSEMGLLNTLQSLGDDDDGAAGGGEESEAVRSAASEDEVDGEGESPSRPPSHAPWMYPSEVRIDPSSLETSPKAERAAAADGEPGSKQLQQLPSLGQSPSPAPAQGRNSVLS